MFEVEYLWKDWVKKDGVTANQFLYDCPNFRYPYWFYLQTSFKCIKERIDKAPGN